MATIAGVQARKWRAEMRMHHNWNDCLDLGHEPGEAHGVAAWEALDDVAVQIEDWMPDDDHDEDADVMESFGGSIFKFEDGSLLLHSDDAVYSERVEVLRGKKRELGVSLIESRAAERDSMLLPGVEEVECLVARCENCNRLFQPVHRVESRLGQDVVCNAC